MATPLTGSQSFCRYAFENAFGTAAADSRLFGYFGHNVKFNYSPKNNIERIPDMNSRNYSKFAAKKFEGSFSVDFDASNFMWLKGIIGSVSTVSGGGIATHSYAETASLSSATIQLSEDMDTDSEKTLVGCVFDKLTLTMTTGEVIKGRIDGFYASESKDSTLNTTGNASDPDEVLTFAHATLDFPQGTTLTEVESLEMSISNNGEIIYGLGSRTGTQRAYKQRDYEFRLAKVREADAEILDRFYGSATTLTNPGTPNNVGSLVLNISNESSGANLRQLNMAWSNLQHEDYSVAYNPAELLKENTTLYALSLSGSASYVNVTPLGLHP